MIARLTGLTGLIELTASRDLSENRAITPESGRDAAPEGEDRARSARGSFKPCGSFVGIAAGANEGIMSRVSRASGDRPLPEALQLLESNRVALSPTRVFLGRPIAERARFISLRDRITRDSLRTTYASRINLKANASGVLVSAER